MSNTRTAGKQSTAKVRRIKGKYNTTWKNLKGLYRELRAAEREANGPNKRCNSFAYKVRVYALNADGAFTTRMAAQAAMGENAKVTRLETAHASNELLKLTKAGKILRSVRLAAETNNNGQLVYFPINK